MKKALKFGIAATAAALAFGITPAQAATLYNNWNYAIDASDDGSGGAIYEMHGLAMQISGNKINIAISSEMPQAGNVVSGTLNGRVNYGDLFFNFTGGNLTNSAAFENANVFGIRFDPNNDSLGNTGSNTTLGVYSNIKVIDLTGSNTGYGSYQQYLDAGHGRNTGAMADLQSSTADVIPYLSNGAQYPNLLSGDKIGDITLLDRSQLNGMGLDFAHFGADPSGNNVFGFSFDKSLLPQGAFTAHLFEECINDGMALQSTTADVPEPSTWAFLVTGGIGALSLVRRRRARA